MEFFTAYWQIGLLFVGFGLAAGVYNGIDWIVCKVTNRPFHPNEEIIDILWPTISMIVLGILWPLGVLAMLVYLVGFPFWYAYKAIQRRLSRNTHVHNVIKVYAYKNYYRCEACGREWAKAPKEYVI